MGRHRIRRLEKSAQNLHTYRTKDGKVRFFDWDDYGSQLFLFAVSLVALAEPDESLPEPPPALRAIWGAEDPQSILDQFAPNTEPAPFFDLRDLPASEEEYRIWSLPQSEPLPDLSEKCSQGDEDGL